MMYLFLQPYSQVPISLFGKFSLGLFTMNSLIIPIINIYLGNEFIPAAIKDMGVILSSCYLCYPLLFQKSFRQFYCEVIKLFDNSAFEET